MVLQGGATRSDAVRIVVLGGGYAGLTTAAQLAGKNLALAITLIDSKPSFEQRIRYHEYAAGREPLSVPYQEFLDARGVAFVRGVVRVLDPGRQTVDVEMPTGHTETVPYDILVYALGSRTLVSTVPGVQAFAHTLDSAAAARTAHQVMAAQGCKRVLVVGGGLTGIETACELAERDPRLSVTLATDRPFKPDNSPGGFSDEGVAYLRHTFARLGISLAENARVTGLTRQAAMLDGGGWLPFDLCFWIGGFAPADLAGRAGIEVNAIGQIRTDGDLRSTSHPNIVAVGDAAEVIATPAGLCRMSCAAARPMAAAATLTVTALVAGRQPEPFRFEYAFRCVSLGRQDGLIQFVDAEDVPRAAIWTGARAARWKEFICEKTIVGIGPNPDREAPDVMPDFDRAQVRSPARSDST